MKFAVKWKVWRVCQLKKKKKQGSIPTVAFGKNNSYQKSRTYQ